ncbi:DUF2958 domain-containing protein [Leifsonia sp. NPDC080035]|uniref:DUF2958 domain-containing protein n=1 Tax=Leifsonia sp. NPDC080035 TaxID=3143936 RepID=A0AAU7GC39_9MICO
MIEIQRERRGYDFVPTEATEWAKLYSTENVKAGEKLLVAHYFIGGMDWYVAEIDVEASLAFGYAMLRQGGDEWGYFSLDELEKIAVHPIAVVERDLYWTPKPAREVLPPEAWDWGE